MQIQISWLLKEPTDLDLHFCKGRVYPGSTGLRLKSLVHVRFVSVKEMVKKMIRDVFKKQPVIKSEQDIPK